MNALEIIGNAKDKFIAIVEENPEIKVKWQTESMFAMQQITANDYTLKAAQDSPKSLRNAVINIASVGLSLNPATAYAYLVPRDGQICLDISYRGLIKVATDTGSIMWAKADVVYERDSFVYHGPAKPPIHTADPFSKERGEIVGVYCIAKTHDGDYLVEVMSEEELCEIRDKSKSATGPKKHYSPWFTFPTEMRKKAVIKRASKTWPKTDRHERLDNLIEYVNQEEGIDFNQPNEEDIKHYGELIHQKNGAAIYNLHRENFDYWSRVESTFYEKGKKGKFAATVKGYIDESKSYVQSVIETIQENENDESIVVEAYSEMNDEEEKMFREMCPTGLLITVDQHMKNFQEM